MDKQIPAVFALLLLAACTLAATANGPEFSGACADGIDFGWVGESKGRIVTSPPVELTGAEEEALVRGEVVTRMIDSPTGGKMGWMRFFAEADPVTVYHILTDNESYAMESPEYKATGSLTNKRRTFMPYTWENIECEEGGRTYVYQLLVMPLVSPRKTNIVLCRNLNGFPWEMAWKETTDAPCEKLADPAMAKWRDKAVPLARNRGSWIVAPVPEGMRRGPEDVNRADVRYFVDTNPGGTIGKLDALAAAAQKQAMPTLAALVNQHGASYEQHVEKYKTPEQLAEFRRLRRAYYDTWKPVFDRLAQSASRP